MESQVKNIAFFSNLFPPVATGSATQSFGLAGKLADKGHKVIVITPHLDPKTPKIENVDGMKIYRIPCIRLPVMKIALNFPWLNTTMSIPNIFRVKKILQEEQIDLIHVHNHMFDLAFMGLVMRFLMKIPMIVTIHTMIKHGNPFFNAILYPLDRFFLKLFIIDRADGIISPDVNMDRYMRERFKRTDSVIIPYGISLPEHPGAQAREQILKQFNLNNKRVILSLGHLHVLRNRLDLIRALPAVKKIFPDLRLVIVGGVMDQRPVDLVTELDLKKEVIFTGPQPHSVIPVFHELAEIEAMWLDQDDSGLNSLGIACMEGMLAGKPVMTVSNIDTFGPGVLVDDENVLILKTGDPKVITARLIDLFSNPEKSKRIGQNAKQIATNSFAWSSVANQTIHCYEKVLAKYKSTHSMINEENLAQGAK